MNTSEITASNPVFSTKSANVYPRDVPIIILGGSPHIVAAPPRLAQNTSASITGIGEKPSKPASSTVTDARKRITVMESINIASTKDITIKVIKIGTDLYFTALAILRHSHLKKPDAPMPSTIIIIPYIKTIVDQFIPVEAFSPARLSYQKSPVTNALRFNVS